MLQKARVGASNGEEYRASEWCERPATPDGVRSGYYPSAH